MIQHVWDKRIIAQIKIDQNDIADELTPLPLFLQLSWNHYIGFYYDEIQAFYSSWVLYPFIKDQFYLTLDTLNLILEPTHIIGHLSTLYNQGVEQPIRLTCHFRNKLTIPNIQLKRYFKNSLKASTSIRNKKLGASILTLQMSLQNVQKMYENFFKNNFKQFLGSDNFQGQDLGYKFVISKTQRIPIKIISKQFILQRGVSKTQSLGSFLAQIFGELKSQTQQENLSKPSNQKQQNSESRQTEAQTQVTRQSTTPIDTKENIVCNINERQKDKRYNFIFEKYILYVHGVRLSRGQYPLSFFQRFCHPDGYLYIIFKSDQ